MKFPKFFIYFFFFIFNVSPKILKNSISIMKFNSHSFQLLLKETMSIGQGSFILKAKLVSKVNHPNPPSVIPFNLNVFTDSRWSKANKITSCKEKIQYSSENMTIYVPSQGLEWSNNIELDLLQSKRPVIWYFFLTDCEKTLPQYTDNTNHLEIFIEILNGGGSHLSYDQEGKLALNLIVIFGYLLILWLIWSKKSWKISWLNITKNPEGVLMRPPVFFLLVSIFFEILTLILDIVHLTKTGIDGNGIYYCDFFSLLFNVISQFSLMLLCILIASGWTLIKRDSDDWEMYITLSVVILLFEIVLVSVDKAIIRNNYLLHSYEGMTMGLVIGIRFVLWANFLFLIIKFFNDNKEKSVKKPYLNTFLCYFSIFSSIYFIGLPVCILATNWWIPDYFKKKFMNIMIISIQFIYVLGLSLMFIDSNSLYNKIRIKKKNEQDLPTMSKND